MKSNPSLYQALCFKPLQEKKEKKEKKETATADAAPKKEKKEKLEVSSGHQGHFADLLCWVHQVLFARVIVGQPKMPWKMPHYLVVAINGE